MNNSWFFDENFNGVPDDFFDDAIKYFDFPLEDLEPNDDGEDWETKFQHLEPPPSNVLASLSSGFCGENSNETLKVKASSLVSVSFIIEHDAYLSYQDMWNCLVFYACCYFGCVDNSASLENKCICRRSKFVFWT